MFIPTHIHTHGLIHTAYQEEGRMKLIYTAYQEEGRTKLIYIYPAYQEEGRMKQVCSVPEETLRPCVLAHSVFSFGGIHAKFICTLNGYGWICGFTLEPRRSRRTTSILDMK